MNIIETNLKISVPTNNKPAYIIIHHALAKTCTIYDIHKWHQGSGWAGCGYHYFISKEGKIYRGRMENQRGSHCKQAGMNMKSIGICLEGCYQDYKNQTDKKVPSAQLDAVASLTKYLMKKYNIGIQRVKRHHDYASYKLCPGNYFPWEKYIKLLENDEVMKSEDKNKHNDYIEEIKHLRNRLSHIREKIYDIERIMDHEENIK